MRLGVIPETWIERILLGLGLVPTPLADTLMAYTLARTVMVGVKADVFEAVDREALSADDIATRCKIHPRVAPKLLSALVAARYLRREGEKYALTARSRKWILKSSPCSLRDKLLFQFKEWEWVTYYDEFVATGQPVRMHEGLSDQEWGLYQRGMRCLAAGAAREVGRRTPLPRGARDMLDIGGSHGLFSVAICRRHPNLRSVVLELPQAVVHARAILGSDAMAERVTYRAGDALKEDLGEEKWDLVFVSQLLHHFDESVNRDLVRRISRSLRPGGMFVVQEMIRPRSQQEVGQIGTLLDLYFAATSEAGTWSLEEISAWQHDAGLVLLEPRRLRTLPGCAQQAAVKRPARAR
jgi:SAM-dependent methyltransferase